MDDIGKRPGLRGNRPEYLKLPLRCNPRKRPQLIFFLKPLDIIVDIHHFF